MTVHDQIELALDLSEQALHELDEHRILKLALKHHEGECPAIGDRGDHVAPEALPGGAYHRPFSYRDRAS